MKKNENQQKRRKMKQNKNEENIFGEKVTDSQNTSSKFN
jgi:hypothetical protein